MVAQIQDVGIMSASNFQIIMLLFGAVCIILWALVQYNVSRFVKRQDSFSEVKDDHEKRLTHIEAMVQNSINQDIKRDTDTNRTFDRIEGNVNEVRQQLGRLQDTIYVYLLKEKE